MGRPKQFLVLHPTPIQGGLAEVTLNSDGFTYHIHAQFLNARLDCEASFNEGGFRGRQWETTGAVAQGDVMLGQVGEGQHASLRAAAQELIVKAEQYSKTLEAARALGLR